MNAEMRRRILAPLASSATAWCGFDSEWYLSAFPDSGGEPGSALQHYIEIGCAKGMSPNMYFDEAWYCTRYPDVKTAVENKELSSGYEHYCKVGYLSRLPHWLYDDEVYAEYAPDLTDQVLVAYGCANRYDHYLKAGAREGRIAHLLFQPAVYAEAMTGSPDGTISDAHSPFHHYLRHIWLGGAEVRTAIYFDPTWYLAHCQAGQSAIRAGRALCALHHFLAAPPSERGEPLPEFQSAFYVEQHPEVATAVAAGRFTSAYEHFLKLGAFSLDAPAPSVDLRSYLAHSPSARADYDEGRVRDLFAHLLANPDWNLADQRELTPAHPLLENLFQDDSSAVRPDDPVVAATEFAAPAGEMFGSHLLIEVDDTILCPPDGLILYGWMLAPPGSIAGLAVSCGGKRVLLDADRFVVVPRTDVISTHGARLGFEDVNCGFIAYVPAVLQPGERPMLEVAGADGETTLRTIPEPLLHGFAAMKALLDRFELRYGALARGFDDVIGPAITSLAAANRSGKVIREVLDFGTPVARPEVSVIVPLYGRIDLMEYQFALFTAHPAGIAHELIYVLDDPPKRMEMLELAQSLHARFAIPFRLVLLSRNVGYAPANNIGVELARGRLVCLLNSDVFPIGRGWLGRLAARLHATPDLTAVGPLLLFEDGSVQHQGIEFEALPEFAGWMFPMHVGKGRRPGRGGGLRRTAAITGACFIIARDTLLDLGGLDEQYAIGDFEDADLCMRLAERGLTCGVDMDVAMHHLERQSQAGPVLRWRMNLTLANAWLHQRRWGARLQQGSTS